LSNEVCQSLVGPVNRTEVIYLRICTAEASLDLLQSTESNACEIDEIRTESFYCPFKFLFLSTLLKIKKAITNLSVQWFRWSTTP